MDLVEKTLCALVHSEALYFGDTRFSCIRDAAIELETM